MIHPSPAADSVGNCNRNGSLLTVQSPKTREEKRREREREGKGELSEWVGLCGGDCSWRGVLPNWDKAIGIENGSLQQSMPLFLQYRRPSQNNETKHPKLRFIFFNVHVSLV
ncbi:Uncharacterized protein TCM_001576 [Theobroma cacao]|uniref:Uncharacterized protein n=1 Tax=Theobroma cacao TaxID=3641 RepID=A0A061DJD9_THECC|nr:Uncharacterized protein TCM_001576 [Theobroma cacao]